ncbi:MAG: DUF177 domain-containing protein [Chlorobi bacterium]|nr:DUF177 domain-containing protein [Chlorobiota bacterium]MCI0717229.1 DUF177 domain-containing protein [Chlorobiota bacterium]
MAIKINIASLKEGSQELELIAGVKEIGLDEKLIKENLLINLELYKLVHQLDINVKISGVMKMECDRCLEVFEKPFEAKFELVYVQKSPREEAIDDDYIRTYNPVMKTIDITNDIKEIVLLSVPMKKLPPEKNDGSCSWCGKPKNYWDNIIIDEEELKNR